MDLARRWSGAERMDDPDVPVSVMEETLRDVDRLNAWLGGWAASRALLEPHLDPGRTLRVLDVGGGSGALGSHLARWARRRGARIRVVTLDRHPAVCRVAAGRTRREPAPRVVRADAFRLPFPDGAFDLTHASLFLHHFADEEIPAILNEMRRVAREGAVVNDLERHPVAYHAIRVLGRVLARSPLVHHDGPVSVRRGFREPELDAWRRSPGLASLRWRRRFPFRYTVWAAA